MEKKVLQKHIRKHLKPDDFVSINVSGRIYETLRTTLEYFPDTLLGNEEKRREYFLEFKNAYYFNHKRECFESILYYYQSKGILVRPESIPMDLFVEEAMFFEIPDKVVEFMQKREGYIITEKEHHDPIQNAWQRRIWELLEYPESSILARIYTMLSIIFILLSISTFLLDTLPQFHQHLFKIDLEENEVNHTSSEHLDTYSVQIYKILNDIEVCCIIWFTTEYAIRFIASPNKWRFFKSFLNLVDLAAVLPYFLYLLLKSRHTSSLGVIRVARLVRVFRVFKLSRYSLGLRIYGNTLKAGINELGMLFLVLLFCMILFSTAIHYAEYEAQKTVFRSIPDTFWFVIITITTTGYGDHVPITPLGKLFGSACVLCGVLALALTVPVLASNFMYFYKRDQFENLKKMKSLATGTAT